MENVTGELSSEGLIKHFKNKYSDGEFDINENGEFCIIQNKVLNPVANFCLIPMGTAKKADGKTTSYFFIVLISDGLHTTVLPKIEVLQKDLGTKNWLRDHLPLGMFYMSESKGYQFIKKFILRSQNKDVLDIYDVEDSGWHLIDNKWVYVHSGGTIGATDKKIRLNDQKSKLIIDKTITPEEAFLESLNMLDICDPKLTHALFSLVLVSVITSPLIQNNLSPRFSMWIEGKTGMGKTSLSKVFTQIFESLKLVHVYDFKKELNKNLMNRDCVSIFDDYGVAKTKKTADLTNEKIEKLIRDIGDREPTSNFTVRPEGMLLFTGERFITMTNADITSTAGRVVRVQMDNLFDKKQTTSYDPVKIEKFNHFEKSCFLSTSMGSYLEWVSEKLSTHFIDHYRKDFELHRNYFSTMQNVHSRLKDSFAHLTVSFHFYLAYGLERGYISPEENALYRKNAETVFWELLKEQAVSPFDPDVQIFIDALTELILEEKITVKVKGIPYMDQKEVLGILDLSDKTLNLVWQPVYEMVVNHICLLTDRSDFISNIKLGKLLREANLIYKSSDKVTKPIGGLIGRAIQFRADKIPNIIESILEINKNRTFNLLLEDYKKDEEEKRRRKEERRAHKENERELEKLKDSMFSNSSRYWGRD